MFRIIGFFIFSFFLLSCGEKARVKNAGDTTVSGEKAVFKEFTQNDSFFRQITIPGKGNLLQAAKDEQSLRDSTFKEKLYLLDGRLVQIKAFQKGKPDGLWINWSDAGQILSRTELKNAKAVKYEAWYGENGQKRVEAITNPDGSITRKEFYANGSLMQSFDVDSLGFGPCSTYFSNNQLRESGRLMNFQPFGHWERYDSLGKRLKDTMYSTEKLKPEVGSR